MFVRDTDGGLPLIEVIKKYKPTMLLGMTGVGGLFTEDVVKEMAAHCDRPVIFPLSNPTIKAECTAEQAFKWTNGQCIFASGSPFDPVTMEDGRTFYPTQCNNSEYCASFIVFLPWCCCTIKCAFSHMLTLNCSVHLSRFRIGCYLGRSTDSI